MCSNRLIIVFAAGLIAVAATQNARAAVGFSYGSGSLAATAVFDQAASGGDLTITLNNTSTADAMVPTDVLTALFFNANGATFNRVSALLGQGSVVHLQAAVISVANGNVGGEWAYVNSVGTGNGNVSGFAGISSSGMGIFAKTDNFSATSLWGPDDVNGLQGAITSAGDDPSTYQGNGDVSKSELIQSSVIFTLHPTSDTWRLIGTDGKSTITSALFQYGTTLGAQPADGPFEPNIIPEPTAVLAGTLLVLPFAASTIRFVRHSRKQ